MLTDDKFQFEVKQNEGRNIVLMQGIIDEDTVFDEILTVDSPVVFNFNNITSINSCGIRNWVNFLKNLAGKDVFFEECPPLIVRQMNMVPSFMGQAKILSIFAPYVCDECETEKLVLITEEQMKEELKEAFSCDSCETGEMELDGHPQQYLAFAK